jgi:hypothetical protein
VIGGGCVLAAEGTARNTAAAGSAADVCRQRPQRSEDLRHSILHASQNGAGVKRSEEEQRGAHPLAV